MSHDSLSERSGCRLLIGGLEQDSDEQELKRAFEKYGRVISVWISRERPGFGYVIFHREPDAEKAVHALNGRNVCGIRIRVEMNSELKRHSKPAIENNRYRNKNRPRPFDPNDRCFNCQKRGHYAYDCVKYNHSQISNHTRPKRFSRSRSPHRSRSRDQSPPSLYMRRNTSFE